MSKPQRTNLSYLFLMVGILLVMCLITIPRLDWDGLWYDEVFSVMNAGGAHYGPLSPVGIWKQVIAEDPYQSLGYPNLLALWGLFVGWTEFATRLSSLLFAMLAVAMTYQLGRLIVNPTVGFFAAMIVSLSTYIIHYAHELRAFTLVAFFAAFTVWAYAHLLRPNSSRLRIMQICFVVGGVGILYTHYFGAMLLIAIGLHHLLFVEKNRKWWEVPILGIVIGVLFLPQLVAFVEGLTRYDSENVASPALSAWGVSIGILRYISNAGYLPAIIALILGVILARKNRQLRMIISVTVFGWITTLIANEILHIIEPSRLRYAVFLWPSLAIWISAGLYYVAKWFTEKKLNPRLAFLIAVILPMFWFINGIYTNFLPHFNDSLIGNYIPRLRTINNILTAEGTPDDLLAFYNGESQQAWYIRIPLDYAMWGIPMPTLLTSALFDSDVDNRVWARDQIADAERVWYAVNRTIPINDTHFNFLFYLQSGFTLCRTYLQTDDLSLHLYTREPSFCPDASPILSFDDAFTLTGYQTDLDDNTLNMYLGWDIAEGVPPETYSLAIHITQFDSPDEIIAQADIGFEAENFASMSIAIDISDLDAGFYQTWLAVYEWESGERLIAQHNQTNFSGERLPVDLFYLHRLEN